MNSLETELNERFRIAVEPDGHCFRAYCPDVEGIHCDGATRGDAIYAAKLACKVYLKSIAKHLEPIVEMS